MITSKHHIPTSLLLIGCLAVFGQTKIDSSRINRLRESTHASLQIILAKEAIKSGDPLDATVTVKNSSSDVIRYSDSYKFHDYQVYVSTASGKEPTRTNLGFEIFKGFDREDLASASRVIELKPNQEESVSLRVSDIYDISKPGLYFLRVTNIHFPVCVKCGYMLVKQTVSFNVY